MEKAQSDIARQKEQMVSEMHDQIVKVALNATEKMLQKKISEKSDKESIEEFIEEVSR